MEIQREFFQFQWKSLHFNGNQMEIQWESLQIQWKSKGIPMESKMENQRKPIDFFRIQLTTNGTPMESQWKSN